MTLNMIVAIIMVIAIVILLLKGVTNPGILFAFVSIIGALIMGYSFRDLSGFLKTGFGIIGPVVFLMVFAILYFQILDEANVFKLLTRWIMKHVGNNVIAVTVVTDILSMVTILEGSGATCALCTIPPLRPVYEKMNIRREALMLVFTFGGGALLFMPWCPAINEQMAYVGSTSMVGFNMLIPVMVFCIVLSLIVAVVVGVLEQRHAGKLSEEEFAEVKKSIDEATKVDEGDEKKHKLMIFDVIFTLVLVASLFSGFTNPNIIFALGLAVLLIVNFGSNKEQGAYLRRQSGRIIGIVVTMFGLAVYLGVANGTGAFNDLAKFLTSGVSNDILIHLPLIICLCVVPLQIFLGNASPAIIVPAIAGLVQPLGVDPIAFMALYFAGHTVSTNLCLFSATPYLALELAGVDIKSQLKFSTIPCILYSWAIVFFGAAIGLIPF